ncbi:hypothetical protein [Evtepia gabavorous]|jgi:hypothetical protein|uniref:hypothetical protein n=1 Tax=Evtepia gabavorous TaxID=2211183 RepID=UPI003A275FF6
MEVLVHNEEKIPGEIVEKAIAMMEREEGRKVVELTIRRTENPDEYGITPIFEKMPFQRIRRITGYLVGDLNRFNNAKLQEVVDRVKHSA